MMPDWLDYDRLQALLAGITVLAALLALLGLGLAPRPALKALAVAVFAVVAVGAFWQRSAIDDARRTDCTRVEAFGAKVVVPGCPRPAA